MDKALKATLANGQFQEVPAQRRRTMSAIKGKGNATTELRLKMALVRAGMSGFSLHAVSLPGRPDFLFERQSVVIFVDGCFWHGCKVCAHAIKSNSGYWATKARVNQARDRRNSSRLSAAGFRVIRIWEHELKDIDDVLKRIQLVLESSSKAA